MHRRRQRRWRRQWTSGHSLSSNVYAHYLYCPGYDNIYKRNINHFVEVTTKKNKVSTAWVGIPWISFVFCAPTLVCLERIYSIFVCYIYPMDFLFRELFINQSLAFGLNAFILPICKWIRYTVFNSECIPADHQREYVGQTILSTMRVLWPTLAWLQPNILMWDHG